MHWKKYLMFPKEANKLSKSAIDLIKRMISDPNERFEFI
jgi:hypothetical protein